VTVGRASRLAAGAAAAVALVAWLALLPGAQGGLVATLGAPESGALQAHLTEGLQHTLLSFCLAAGSLWVASRGRGRLALVSLAGAIWAAGVAASGFALRPGSVEARLGTAPPPLVAPSPGPRVLRLGDAQGTVARPEWNAIDRRNAELAASFTPNFNARARVDSFTVDTGLEPVRWRRLVDAAGPYLAALGPRYAVTHLVLPSGMVLRSGSPVVADPRSGMTAWSVPHREWASFPREAVIVDGAEAAIAAVVQMARDGRRAAVVEAPGAPLATGQGRVARVSRTLERLEIEAEADGDALLVVNDAWWPGWRAYVDGRETPIYLADALVRAVSFPSGRHTLTMRYEPPELRRGWLLTGAGFSLLSLAAVLLRRRRGAWR
jgi:hypothetical protein